VTQAETLVALDGLGLGAVALLGLLRWQRRPSAPSETVEIRFARGLTADGVVAVLTGLAGLSRTHQLVLDVVADRDGIRHYAHSTPSGLRMVRGLLRGAASDVQLVAPEDAVEPRASLGARARFVGPRGHVLLDSDAPDQTAGLLLGVLGEPLARDEHLLLRLALTPAGTRRLPREPSSRQTGPTADPLAWLGNGRSGLSSAERRGLEQKYRGRLLTTRITVGVAAETDARGRELVGRVLAVLRGRQGAVGRLRVRWLGGSQPRRALMASGRGAAATFSPGELAGLLAWPINGPQIDGLRLDLAPRLSPRRSVPRTGRVFAYSDRDRSGRPLAQPIAGGLQHAVVLGGTGSGKSTLIQGLVAQDLAAGRGALVVDAKGDLVSDLLARIPDQRRDDVILLDPASAEPQPGLRLFAPAGDVELTADALIGTLAELFADEWGVRSRQYFRLGLVTLGRLPDPTLLELPRLFAEPTFRAQALRGADPLLRAAWQRFDALSPADQVTQLAAPMTKFEELVGRARLRVVLGQRHPRLHFGEVLARGRIVLVRLPPGLLGSPAARLLASVVLWQFFQAVEARAGLPTTDRPPFMAYVDEVAWLDGLGLPLGDLLERARGLGVGMLLAPQALARLAAPLRSSLLANAGTIAAFRLSRAEAKVVADELPGITAEQLQHLERFHVALRLAFGPGQVSSVMTGTTPPPSDPSADAAELRAYAAGRWGLSLSEVDAALIPPATARRTNPAAATDDQSGDGRVPRSRTS
jgi:hypothetical protein